MNLVPSVAGSIGTNAKALSAYDFLLIVIGQCIHNNVHIAYNVPFLLVLFTLFVFWYVMVWQTVTAVIFPSICLYLAMG